MVKINNGEGILGRLIQDSVMAENINQTTINIKRISKKVSKMINKYSK